MSLISVGLNSAGKWISRARFEYHYSRRKYDALRAGRLKTFEQDDVYIFLFLNIYIFFSFSTALQKLQNILTCFPEGKISKFYPDSNCLNISCFLLHVHF